MALSETPDDRPPKVDAKKSSKLTLVLSFVLCFLGSGIGYIAVSQGFVTLPFVSGTTPAPQAKSHDGPDVAFVSIPTLIITLPPNADSQHLRFSAEIEVRREFQEEVEFSMPRIQNFLNGYLRALTAEDIEGQGSLFRIRLQVFRRIVAIVGLGKVNNLLVTEFILN